MPPPNHERNALLYIHWRDGNTAEETAALTGIPKSTVGYYYRKFNRYAKMGIDPPVLLSVPQPPEETSASMFLKTISVNRIFEWLRTDDPQTFYYRLAGVKLASEIVSKLRLTAEERKQFPRLISDWIAATALKKAQQS